MGAVRQIGEGLLVHNLGTALMLRGRFRRRGTAAASDPEQKSTFHPHTVHLKADSRGVAAFS